EDFHDVYNGADLADRLVFTGYVDRQTLTALLENARVLAIVSLMEGFGLPVLEAMAANVPVLSSNVSSLPEVAGDAAFYVDPLDVDSITKGLHRLLSDEALRTDLTVRGVKRLNNFSWESAAQKTMDVFLAAVGKKP
ncbi:MAG: glycosyltransferase, partial [Nitrospirae bacterium]|nr:glycosyltransferase [Nitrospirota bacterium]